MVERCAHCNHTVGTKPGRKYGWLRRVFGVQLSNDFPQVRVDEATGEKLHFCNDSCLKTYRHETHNSNSRPILYDCCAWCFDMLTEYQVKKAVHKKTVERDVYYCDRECEALHIRFEGREKLGKNYLRS